MLKSVYMRAILTNRAVL